MRYTLLLTIWTLFTVIDSYDPVQRIVGGADVTPPGKHPWQGYLLTSPVYLFTCGCVLVDTRVALTAAHCVDGYEVEFMNVVFGAHDRVTEAEGEPIQYAVQNVTMHPDFIYSGDVGFPNDIAVLLLSEDAKVSSVYITPIALPQPGRGPSDWLDKTCEISGWGRPSAVGDLPNVLQDTEISVITEETCRELWDDGQIGEFHVCVWEEDTKDKASCTGDSGGPLVCSTSSLGSPPELVGLTSWGIVGCAPTYPSVYVRVSHFSEWVQEVIDGWGVSLNAK